jgi:phosphopantetheine adenylyltransferase
MAIKTEQAQIEVIINGKKANATMKEMEASAKVLNAQLKNLTPGTKEFIEKTKELGQVNKRLNSVRDNIKEVSGSMGKMERAFSGFKAAFTAAFAVGAIIEGAKAVFDFTKELYKMSVGIDQLNKKVKTVFGESTAFIKESANSMAKDLGLTRNQFIEAATSAGDLLIPMGFTRDEAAKLSVSMVGLSGALSEWTNGKRSAAEVSEILTKALLGEREQLKELGISITEDDIKTELLIRGKEKLTGTALQQAKALITQELVMRKSIDAQTAFANNSESTARIATKTAATFEDLKERMAEGLTPAFADLTKFAGDAVDNSGPLQQAFKDLFTPIQDVWHGILDLVRGLGFFKKDASAGEVVAKSLATAFTILTYPIKLVYQGFLLLIDGLKQTVAAGSGVAGMFSSIGTSVTKAWQAIKSADISGVTKAFSTLGSDSAAAYTKAYNEKIKDFKPAEAAPKKEVKEMSPEESKRLADLQRLNEEAAAKDLDALKEAQKKKEEAQKEYQKRVLKTEEDFQELRISLIENKFDQESERLKLKTQKRIEALAGTPEMVRHSTDLLNEELRRGLEEIEKQRDDHDQKKKQERLEKDVTAINTEEQIKEEIIWGNFYRALASEEERDMALYDAKQTALNERLLLLQESGMQETLAYQQTQTEILAIDAARNQQIKENAQKTAEFERVTEEQKASVKKEFLDLGIQFLSRDEQARKKNAALIKAFAVSKVLIDMQQEIAGYYANPASTASLGTIGTIKTILAVARAGAAVATIAGQKFKRGTVMRDGSYHSNGGISLIDRKSGSYLGEMEKDETILTGAVARDPNLLREASRINEMAGGKRLFAGGGIPASTTPQLSSTSVNSSGNLVNSTNTANLEQVLIRLSAAIENMPELIKAYILLSDIEEAIETNENINDEASVQ